MSKIPLNRGDLQKLQIFPLIPNQPYLNGEKKKKKNYFNPSTFRAVNELSFVE